MTQHGSRLPFFLGPECLGRAKMTATAINSTSFAENLPWPLLPFCCLTQLFLSSFSSAITFNQKTPSIAPLGATLSTYSIYIKKHTEPFEPYAKPSNMPFTASDICKILLAIILPPIGVFLERGCGADLLINILLTILGYIPGIIHALYIILKY
ncbi:hypothetical protein GGI42DRAFT_311840 [Trichoderma sp. SZMC 28013]